VGNVSRNVGMRTETVLYILSKFMSIAHVSAEKKRLQIAVGKWNKKKKKGRKYRAFTVTVSVFKADTIKTVLSGEL